MRYFGAAIVLTAAAFLAQACSSGAVRVMPGPEGIHNVVVRHELQYKAEVKAVKAANKYCRKRGQDAIFLAESTDYTGTMKESTREAIRQGAQAAEVIAGTLRTVDSDDAAIVFDAASGVGRVMTSGKDYRAEVNFRCEP